MQYCNCNVAGVDQEVPLDCRLAAIGKTLVIRQLTYHKYFKLSVNEDTVLHLYTLCNKSLGI